MVGVPNIIDRDRIQIGPLKDKNVEQLRKTIQASPEQQAFQDKHQVIESAENLDALIDLSDYIVHIRPTAIAFVNPSLKAVEFELLEQFKGDERFKEKQIIRLPSSIELEQEYLVFYRIYDSERDAVNPGITLTTRHGSVIAKQEDLLWKSAIETLEKHVEASSEE
ncbi:hypothetical protein DUZ99_10510 [Xylanibacillus composti]|uniref:Uncharacterized protein n=1 Tax=Xylanibacillus composti TaxID=1572762 RepID=A0A8J4H5Q9_9BACL|nr:hypothetical protein [Xylanibacillus composti]MDT9725402.1 hypothetical protein [Xylanibacillus composti]GIQ71447.1 hypothetical protein XYCOK13_42710 [Xylanibacillus composti]